MHFLALASDYDGTLADDGNITGATWSAVQRLRTSGRKLILVTGRSFANLERVLPRLEAFEAIVAENGAVLYCSAEHRTVLLSGGLPKSLVEQLQFRRVEPLWIGEIILATRTENAHQILEAVRDLELEVGIVTNNNTSLIFTRPDEARQFAEATGVDVLAPAVGNMHGLLAAMVRGEARKRLDIGRITQIKAATRLPLTLHGGSATDDDDFRRAIEAGMTIIHISTELRLAWRRGLEATLAAEPDNLVPYQLFRKSSEAIEDVVTNRLKLFNRL